MSVVLSEHLPLLASAPDGIQKLRGLILELAVRGMLVPQDPDDEPASELLKRIAQERARLEAAGVFKKAKLLSPASDDELPFALPSNWAWTNLATIALINPRNAADDSIESSFVPMAMIGNRFEGSHQQELRKWGEVKQGFTHFAEGDVGVAKITPCFENSKACVFAGLKNGIGAGTTELHIVRPIGQTLAPRYALAYLKAPMFLLTGETKMTGTAGQKRLPKDFLEANPFPLPPLAEQHRIVAKVDELMALCDRLEAEQADATSAHARLVESLLGTLTQSTDAADLTANWQRLAEHFDTLFSTEASIEALKQTVLQLAVMGKLVPQNPADEPANELLKRIAGERARLEAEGVCKKSKGVAPVAQDDRPFDLPDSWSWIRLGHVVIESGAGWSPSCEQRPREGHEWGVLKVSAVSWGAFAPEQNKALPANLEPRPEHEVVVGDFLVSRANTAELVARSVVVEDCPRYLMLSDKIVRLKLSKLIDGRFINFSNSCEQARKYYAAVAGGTSASMKNVSREQILNLVIPLPPLAEQHRIVAKVNELTALCDRLKADLAESHTRQARLSSVLIESALQAA